MFRDAPMLVDLSPNVPSLIPSCLLLMRRVFRLYACLAFPNSSTSWGWMPRKQVFSPLMDHQPPCPAISLLLTRPFTGLGDVSSLYPAISNDLYFFIILGLWYRFTLLVARGFPNNGDHVFHDVIWFRWLDLITVHVLIGKIDDKFSILVSAS